MIDRGNMLVTEQLDGFELGTQRDEKLQIAFLSVLTRGGDADGENHGFQLGQTRRSQIAEDVERNNFGRGERVRPFEDTKLTDIQMREIRASGQNLAEAFQEAIGESGSTDGLDARRAADLQLLQRLARKGFRRQIRFLHRIAKDAQNFQTRHFVKVDQFGGKFGMRKPSVRVMPDKGEEGQLLQLGRVEGGLVLEIGKLLFIKKEKAAGDRRNRQLSEPNARRSILMLIEVAGERQ